VFHVAENQPAGSHVGSVSAVDRDEPPRDQFVYVIARSPEVTSQQGVRIDAECGRLTTTQSYDRERQSVYRLMVSARATTGVNNVSSTTLDRPHVCSLLLTYLLTAEKQYSDCITLLYVTQRGSQTTRFDQP